MSFFKFWRRPEAEGNLDLAADRLRHRRCPDCGSRRVVEMIYGYPNPDVPFPPGAESGGCIRPIDATRWKCRRCGAGWGLIEEHGGIRI